MTTAPDPAAPAPIAAPLLVVPCQHVQVGVATAPNGRAVTVLTLASGIAHAVLDLDGPAADQLAAGLSAAARQARQANGEGIVVAGPAEGIQTLRRPR